MPPRRFGAAADGFWFNLEGDFSAAGGDSFSNVKAGIGVTPHLLD
jgi:hypothetical protein